MKDALASMKNALDLNPWSEHLCGRYTFLLHQHSNKSEKVNKRKGSLSVVHITSDDSVEESDHEEKNMNRNSEVNTDPDNQDSHTPPQ